MRALVVGALLALGASCSRPAAQPTAYQRDIDRLCHAQEHSGAAQLEPGYGPVAIAQWLSENLETDEVRELLAEFHRAEEPATKQAILEREAEAVGLPDCPLAELWASADAD